MKNSSRVDSTPVKIPGTMKVVEEEQPVVVLEGPWSPASVIRDVVADGAQEDPFYVMDLGEVVARFRRWKELMPRVEPFYGECCGSEGLCSPGIVEQPVVVLEGPWIPSSVIRGAL